MVTKNEFSYILLLLMEFWTHSTFHISDQHLKKRLPFCFEWRVQKWNHLPPCVVLVKSFPFHLCSIPWFRQFTLLCFVVVLWADRVIHKRCHYQRQRPKGTKIALCFLTMCNFFGTIPGLTHQQSSPEKDLTLRPEIDNIVLNKKSEPEWRALCELIH